MTPIGHQLQNFIDAEWKKLERDKITHWQMNFRRGLNIDDGRGGKITLGGDMAFEGTPRKIFWQSIDPHLDDTVTTALRMAHDLGRQFANDVAVKGMEDTRLLLHGLVNRTFGRMVEVDRAMRGKGYPDNVAAYDASGPMATWIGQIDQRHSAYISAYEAANVTTKQTKVAKFMQWCDQHRVEAIVTLTGAILGLVVVILEFL
jgi:hypothetical protein